ncbi:MAG: carbamoyltransferase HypF, partial [Acidimicrobiales bacterium]
VLVGGGVVAVKGLGGYHLAADATSDAAVAELRRRKARDDKAFAVMVADLATAHEFCQLSDGAVAALVSPRRPIVLAPRRPGAAVASAVAPGLGELGLMLAYTPLHHLLLERVARSLVMTSGNLSDEPIAHDDADAVIRLGPMVDAVLSHDRAIHIRCDDSVVRSVGPGAVQMVRRSRGYAPEPLALPVAATRPILALGAELKSTVAVAKGAGVVASHHIGDLEHLPAYRSFLQAVDHLCHLAGVEPELVAHDLHPEYLSTKYAMDLDLPLLGVQHHHAHIASCLVDNNATGPVLGVAFDGLGLGCDGQLWGGEFLVADLWSSRRVGHLRPVALPGGARAMREPWRMALTWTNLTLGPEAAARYGASVDERWPAVLRLAEHAGTAATTSAGRLFDAVAALLGIRPRISYEGQAAIELEAVARRAAPPSSATAHPLRPLVPRSGALAPDRGTRAVAEAAAAWPLAVERGDEGLAVLDLSPLIARVVAERDAGTPVPVIAAAFHAGLGQAAGALAVVLARTEGLDTVALSGGVFQNALLTESVAEAVRAAGLTVLVHRRVPPNDGGVSIGQAAIAAAVGSPTA